MTKRILRIDSSSRKEGSYSRLLTDQMIAKLKAHYPDAEIVNRDLAKGLPFVNNDMVTGMIAGVAGDNIDDPKVKKALEFSDFLIEEIKSAETLVFGVPVYNFSIPAALKAYIDLICRSEVTFRYRNKISEGLLKDTKTYLIMVSGGTAIGSGQDYASGYLKHVLSFIGITNLEVIVADQIRFEGAHKLKAAQNYINNINLAETI